MINRLAKLFALTAAAIPCAGFAGMPDAVIQEDGSTPRFAVLNASRLVSNDELSEMRGGFFTAAGAQFDFGASVQTMVNGQLALLTKVQWTQAGAVTQQLQGLGVTIQTQVTDTVAGSLNKAGIATPGTAMQTNSVVDPPTTNALASSMPATDTANSAPTSSAPAAVAPATSLAANSPAAPASAPANAPTIDGAAPMVLTGVQIPGATGGATQVFANIGGGQIQNVILNSASGQDITQNTNINLTIYNFAAWQQSVAQRMLSARLANDMLAASGISAGH